ncbi:MAG TPA: hypothetical protein VKC66_14065 [Xanthobacteraceae bacterium]|nr:hypothetical protein [Xanthobacteraceae bacterium]
MFSLTELRRLGPLLLGLLLLAQAAGVVPLISTHIHHAFENMQDIAADLSETGTVTHVHYHHTHHDGGQHEHGTNDPNDQCCTLHHHLAGVLSIAVTVSRSDLIVTIVAVSPQSLVGTEPRSPERPPKHPLSI